jgi:hypothetical protein
VSSRAHKPTIDGAESTSRFPVSRDIQHGGQTLIDASCFVRRLGGTRETGDRRVGVIHGSRAVWAVWRGVPKVSVNLTASSCAELMSNQLAIRRWGVPKNRIAQGVLPIPSDLGTYLRAGHRLVRRQVRRASEAGIECRMLPGPEREAVLDELTARKQRGCDDQDGRQLGAARRWSDDEAAGWSERSDDEWWAAIRPDGTSVALASICVDEEWAFLRGLISVEHPARYLLHLRLVEELAGREVRYLWTAAPSALLQTSGLQYFHEIVNLIGG